MASSEEVEYSIATDGGGKVSDERREVGLVESIQSHASPGTTAILAYWDAKKVCWIVSSEEDSDE